MNPSLEDVAKLAGVSASTVSRALRDLPKVSAETRARVRAAADKLDYHPNPAASTLAGGLTNTVAMIVPEFELAYYGHVIAAAEAVISREGRRLLLYRVRHDRPERPLLNDAPLRGGIDGMIIVNVDPSDALTPRLASTPIVTIGDFDAGYPAVNADDIGGAERGANHVIGLGHRRLAILVGPIDTTTRHSDLRERRTGWRRAAARAGTESTELSCEMTFAGGREAMTRLLSGTSGATAVLAASDEVALGAMKVARDVGLDVPRDISIVGYDDSGLAEAVGLTTVNQSVYEHGARAAELLQALLEGKHAEASTTIATHLVIRSSSAPPPPTQPVWLSP